MSLKTCPVIVGLRFDEESQKAVDGIDAILKAKKLVW